MSVPARIMQRSVSSIVSNTHICSFVYEILQAIHIPELSSLPNRRCVTDSVRTVNVPMRTFLLFVILMPVTVHESGHEKFGGAGTFAGKSSGIGGRGRGKEKRITCEELSVCLAAGRTPWRLVAGFCAQLSCFQSFGAWL